MTLITDIESELLPLFSKTFSDLIHKGYLSETESTEALKTYVKEHLPEIKHLLSDSFYKLAYESSSEISEETESSTEDKILFYSVKNLNLGTRANNCLMAANIKTIGELIELTEEDLMRIPNMGLNSVEKIESVLDYNNLSLKYLKEAEAEYKKASTNLTRLNGMGLVKDVLQALALAKFRIPRNNLKAPTQVHSDLVTELNLSARASNCLESANIKNIQFLITFTKQSLLEIPNMGRSSVQEIINALSIHGLQLNGMDDSYEEYQVNPYINSSVDELNLSENLTILLKSLTIETVGTLTSLGINDLINLGIKSVYELKSALADKNLAVGMLIDSWPLNFKKGSPLKNFQAVAKENDLASMNNFMIFCIYGLVNPSSNILALRYGLESKSLLTLEEVGQKVSLTRERVRQLEAKAALLLNSLLKEQADAIYVLNKTEIINELFSHKLRLSQDELTAALKRLTTPMIFLINIFFDGVKSWAAKELTNIDGYYINGDINPDGMKQKSLNLQKLYEEIKLPCPISEISSTFNMPESDINNSLLLLDYYKSYKNYLTQGMLSIRIRRAINAHLVLSNLTSLDGNFITINMHAFLEEYKKWNDEDNCSTRDLDIVFLANPHLFLKLYDYGWAALSPQRAFNNSLSNHSEIIQESAVPNIDRVEPNDEISVREHLYNILNKKIYRFEDLRKQFMKDTKKAFAKTSVGPVLINNQGWFQRYAPSIYGLREKQDDLEYINSGKDALLEDDQCELYCLASVSGVGVGEYPLWTWDMEYKWATWLAKDKKGKLLSNLLFVSKPENWQCSDWEKKYWINEKNKLQFFSLFEKNRFDLLDTSITIHQLIAASVVSAANNFSSWTLINRSIGARIDDRHSISLLALLISLGLIKPNDHWQLPHYLDSVEIEKITLLVKLYSRYMIFGEHLNITNYLHELFSSSKAFGWVEDSKSLFNKFIKDFGAVSNTPVLTDPEISIEDQLKDNIEKAKLRDLIASLGE